jgi:hypothetical protein
MMRRFLVSWSPVLVLLMMVLFALVCLYGR